MPLDFTPPPDSPNRVRFVKKLEGGGLEVTLESGQVLVLEPEDEFFQAFVVWSMLA